MLKLSPAQEEIHQMALSAARRYLRLEFDLVDILDKVDRSKLLKRLNCPSLFVYATSLLGLSEGTAYALIAIARKAREVPELRKSGISISKASRIVSVLTPENSARLIDFARTHSKREIEYEVARINPKAARPESVRALSETISQLSLPVSQAFLAKLKRVQSLEAQRKSGGTDMVAAVEAAMDEYLFRRDPVHKAERAQQRKAKTMKEGELLKKDELVKEGEVVRTAAVVKTEELCPRRVRVPLTAAQKHEVFARDGGRCSHRDESGKICGSDRWVEVHHIRSVSRGGGNEPENLTTLCSFHHDLAHQLSLPVDGRVNWLRDRTVSFG